MPEVPERKRFPQLWTKSVVVQIHKKKDKLSCDNYRGVSLLSHCGKVMTSIIMQRIRLRTEEIISEYQAGFWAGRSTIDQLFTLRRLTKTYIEFSKCVITRVTLTLKRRLIVYGEVGYGKLCAFWVMKTKS